MKQRVAKSRVQEIVSEPQQPREAAQSDVQRWIAEAAYYRAASRGFEPGGETQDWLAAEAEILGRVRDGRGIL
jgi:hypothetical protein